MDAEQLQQLATNAELNHWPPHLGVTTDAEKIEYLAQRLREVADTEERADGLEDELAEMRLANDALQEKANDLQDQNAELQDRVASAELRLKEAEETIGQLEARQ